MNRAASRQLGLCSIWSAVALSGASLNGESRRTTDASQSAISILGREGALGGCSTLPCFSGGRYRVIEAGATKDGATIALVYPLPGYCVPR
jgi:hypothetical protein